MSDFEELNETIEVPKNTGIAGFLKALEVVLRKPRVQSINIDARGKVSVRRYVVAGEADPIGVDFDSVTPYQIIRGSQVSEVEAERDSAVISLAKLFNQVTARRLFPLGVVLAPSSRFWDWLKASSSLTPANREQLFGVPVVLDTEVESSHLFLCAGFTRNGALIDTQEAYKLQIPEV